MILREAGLSQQDVEKRGAAKTLTERQVGCLLAERGYALVERMQHVHASSLGQEWHICQFAELAWLTPEQFLQRLEEALSFHVVSPVRSSDPGRSTLQARGEA
jgi:hypothetical protein